MADLQFAVREIERRFTDEYYAEITNQISLIPEYSRKLKFLHNIISNNSSQWSGGFSATNMEESIKRDVAINIMGDVISQLTWELAKQTEAL
jgi:hypothetical protein